jgi:monoamine oxidase
LIIRDQGSVPKIAFRRSVDVCVVGGGLAGLSAAYKLREANVLVAEHLEKPGGHATRDSWNGVWFSGAGAYVVEPEEPFTSLYSDLKAPLKKISEPADSGILSWNSVLDVWGNGLHKLPYPSRVHRDFARARVDFKKILNSINDYPNMPIDKASSEARKLDNLTFADWMLNDRHYHPAVKAFVDLYCRSSFGAQSSADLSAFAGLNFYAAEFASKYTMPGGTAMLGELLRSAIERAGLGRILTGTTAVRVEPNGNGVTVTLVDGTGNAQAVDAQVVILAVPKFVAKRIVVGLGAEQRAAMGGLRYGHYVVGNVLCSAPIVADSYDTWTDTTPFTDFIVADWVSKGAGRRQPSEAQVLTIYFPIGYDGSSLLVDSAYDDYRERVVGALNSLFPGCSKKIADVRLYRWGHAMCHAAPGWYTKQSPIASKPAGRVLFAHSDNLGLPAVESALGEGLAVGEEAKGLLAKR